MKKGGCERSVGRRRTGEEFKGNLIEFLLNKREESVVVFSERIKSIGSGTLRATMKWTMDEVHEL